VLFEVEGSEKDAEAALRYQCEDMRAVADVAQFARTLVEGCRGRREAVDAAIIGASTNWELEHLGKVERAILRLGAYELLYQPGTPAPVIIDESVELAKTYAGHEAARFVNGVLGHVSAGPGTAVRGAASCPPDAAGRRV